MSYGQLPVTNDDRHCEGKKEHHHQREHTDPYRNEATPQGSVKHSGVLAVISVEAFSQGPLNPGIG